MKLFKYIALCSVAALSLTSCNDWLDVNTDPDSPSAESILVQNRLPWILKQHTYAAGCANTRTFATCGGFYSNNANMYNVSVSWDGVNAKGLTTTPYQTWFVGTGGNIVYMYNKAEAEGAYHYMAAAEVMHALGFMYFLDLYGEIPYTEALGSSPVPAYSDGKTIWEGCLAKIDHAIELFQMQQDPSLPTLAEGDIWNNGDVNKWIKLCYGLKARWMLRVTKNANYYKPDEILAALEKAPQSIEDDTYQVCFDEKGDKTDFLLGDPVMTNGNWDTAAYGSQQFASKYHVDLLTNMRGAGVEDPRVDHIIPQRMTDVSVELKDGKVSKIKDYKWRRATGVDMYGDAERLVAGGGNNIQNMTFALANTQIVYKFEGANKDKMAGFIEGVKSNGYTTSTDSIHKMAGRTYKTQFNDKEIEDNKLKDKDEKLIDAVAVSYPAGAWYINHVNFVFAGDTVYGNYQAGSQNVNNGAYGLPATNTYCPGWVAAAAQLGVAAGTGAYQIFAQSDFEVLTYAEMCFIKAEVLFRKGDKGGALTAYKNGIQANFDRMQKKLNEWKGSGYTNPAMMPMDPAAISAYMASNAVCQNSGDLTMKDIMLQKYVAMGWSIENWVDMRRFNYSAGNVGGFGVVYPEITRTKLYTGASSFKSDDPQNVQYWFRRWRLPNALELQYNAPQAVAMNAHALQDWVWCIPVWWDCNSDEEYFNYLK